MSELPPPPAGALVPGNGPEAVLVTLGDITVSRSWLVTPAGNAPIAGATITVTDLTRTESRIPPWAIVLAILGALFFLLGLLFLLARENFTTGTIQVTVQNGSFFHATQIPVQSAATVADVHTRANYVRQLIAAAS